jgi:hypothetical protein
VFCSKSVNWLYRLESNFSWDSPLDIKQDYAFKDNRGVVRLILEHGGRITVTRGYAWNGCSPKFCFLDILFGVPDGVVDSDTGRPKTYYASLVHDALYQFVPDGLPLKQHDADRCFLKLMEATGFRLRRLYFSAVWSIGWLIWRAKRRVRKTAGTAFPL